MIATVYLEASAKIQELLTLKWLLRAAGFEVCSTWHDEAGISQPVASHLSPFRLEQLRRCDALVVLSNQPDDFKPELGVLVGLALAWGRKILYVGAPNPALAPFPVIRRLENAAQVVGALSPAAPPDLLAA